MVNIILVFSADSQPGGVTVANELCIEGEQQILFIPCSELGSLLADAKIATCLSGVHHKVYNTKLRLHKQRKTKDNILTGKISLRSLCSQNHDT